MTFNPLHTETLLEQLVLFHQKKITLAKNNFNIDP